MEEADPDESAGSSKGTASSRKLSYWSRMVSHCEKRNASLEQRQTELSERIRLMECAVPSLLMGAMVSGKRNTVSVAGSSSSSRTSGRIISGHGRGPTSEDPDRYDLRLRRFGAGRSTDGEPETNRFAKNTDFRP